MTRQRIRLTQVTELTQLPAEASLVGSRHSIDAFGTFRCAWPRIFEGRSSRVVIDEESLAGDGVANLPASRQRTLVHEAHFLALRPRILPLRRSVLVIHEVHAVVGLDALLPAIRQCAESVVFILHRGLRGVAGLRMLRIQEPLVALRHHVLALPLPVLEVHQPLAVRSLPGRAAVVVIDVIHSTARIASDLPARRQRTRLLPVGRFGVVIDVVAAAVGVGSSLPASRKRLVVAVAHHLTGLDDCAWLRRLQRVRISWRKAVIRWRLIGRWCLIPIHPACSSHSSS